MTLTHTFRLPPPLPRPRPHRTALRSATAVLRLPHEMLWRTTCSASAFLTETTTPCSSHACAAPQTPSSCCMRATR
eukprot:286648-Chlamydomonas_euryale.AAC.2